MTTSFHPGTRRVKHAHALVVGLWGALFLALLLVPVALGQTRPQQRTRAGAQVRTVQVPNVTGRSVEEARTILAHGGLRLGTVSEGEARGAPKTVYGQKPPAGTVVALGTPVSVWVVAGRKPPAGAGTDQPAGSTTSSYPQATRVPPLIGSNVPQASQILERYRLVLGNVNKVNSNQARAGIIIRQDPPANRTVRVGSSVNVWVAVAKQQPAEPGNTYSPSGEQQTGPTLTNPPMTKVPGLIGRDVRPAAQLLNSYRLVLGNVNKVNSNQAQPGVIIRQYPAAGATVPAGTPVSVWVAQEQPPTVPNLVGNDVRNAPQILGSQLVLGNVRQEETDQAAPGTVLAQNPPAGTRVAAGSGVSVVVAKSQPVEVPDLRGRTAAEAILMLGNKRLNLGTTSQEYTDGKEKAGAVLRQEPVAGTRVPPGTRVNVTVARERQVTVPNVVGQKQANAEGLLDKAGLRLGSVGQRNSPAESGTVLRQDPGAGTQVRAGTAVNVVISQPIGQLLLKVDDAKPVVGQAVRFQAQMTTGAAGAEYQFIFGDGTPGKWTTAAAANHIYQAAGNYRVGVVARVGGQQLSSEPLEVRAQGVRVRLTVESGDAGRDNPVRFTAVLEPTSSQAEYRFVFGDHEETGWTRAAAAEHAYKQSGTYRAHVIARVGRGPFVESNAATVKIGWGVVPMLILGGGGTLLVGGAGIYWYLKRLLRLVRIGVRADATGSQQIEAPALGQWFADVRVRVVRSLGDQTIEWEAPLARGKGVGHE